ncbi:hypothetical protein Tdes44962_MAKER05496 [Teratosphaeria destructans]|uniref:Uncharacterized protein n=1 Tax=Teratosphaeria destructans TaxID=418781 RepID=A0A9W7SJV4_9PEZI|nr:hypothetical protein Tdes44962_MAKER05496 [Teratosphaeria destructans]
METLSTEFAGLPVIVSDYDAILKPSSIELLLTATNDMRTTTPYTDPCSSRSNSPPLLSSIASPLFTDAHPLPLRAAGFAELADAFWSRLTSSMKSRIRTACIEVLKRVNDPSEEEKIAWMYDDDSRFLE